MADSTLRWIASTATASDGRWRRLVEGAFPQFNWAFAPAKPRPQPQEFPDVSANPNGPIKRRRPKGAAVPTPGAAPAAPPKDPRMAAVDRVGAEILRRWEEGVEMGESDFPWLEATVPSGGSLRFPAKDSHGVWSQVDVLPGDRLQFAGRLYGGKRDGAIFVFRREANGEVSHPEIPEGRCAEAFGSATATGHPSAFHEAFADYFGAAFGDLVNEEMAGPSAPATAPAKKADAPPPEPPSPTWGSWA